MSKSTISAELAALEAAIPDGHTFPADGIWPEIRLENPDPGAMAPLHAMAFALGDGSGSMMEVQVALLQAFIPGLSPASALRLQSLRPDVVRQAWEMAALPGKPVFSASAVAAEVSEDEAEAPEAPQPVNPS